ncbi:hypothetical protein LUZ62_088423 [Rhynchospora pubera]|uniref:Uncharacterized protein n=1 Tax=Rhynchospora pubera TaxID=906938 RepID=A0AAV8CDS6_9POAL|nr:hypothetical protein LUZ62_088423 [Rhynchospora pubera]
MASPPSPKNNTSSQTPIDALFLQNLMSRMQLRPPYLDSNSFLNASLEDLLHLSTSLPDSFLDSYPDPDSDVEPELDFSSDSDGRRRALAKEEAKLEKEIIRLVKSGDAEEVLKPNSGQSVSVGDHSICVGFHVDKESEYRVWEWHGHIMLYDDKEGYSAEYVYGNHFERLTGENKKKSKEEKDLNSGLRDLISGDNDSNGRVIHRNSVVSSNGSASGDPEGILLETHSIFTYFWLICRCLYDSFIKQLLPIVCFM